MRSILKPSRPLVATTEQAVLAAKHRQLESEAVRKAFENNGGKIIILDSNAIDGIADPVAREAAHNKAKELHEAQKAADRLAAKEKRDAKALAEGRVPGKRGRKPSANPKAKPVKVSDLSETEKAARKVVQGMARDAKYAEHLKETLRGEEPFAVLMAFFPENVRELIGLYNEATELVVSLQNKADSTNSSKARQEVQNARTGLDNVQQRLMALYGINVVRQNDMFFGMGLSDKDRLIAINAEHEKTVSRKVTALVNELTSHHEKHGEYPIPVSNSKTIEIHMDLAIVERLQKAFEEIPSTDLDVRKEAKKEIAKALKQAENGAKRQVIDTVKSFLDEGALKVELLNVVILDLHKAEKDPVTGIAKPVSIGWTVLTDAEQAAQMGARKEEKGIKKAKIEIDGQTRRPTLMAYRLNSPINVEKLSRNDEKHLHWAQKNNQPVMAEVQEKLARIEAQKAHNENCGKLCIQTGGLSDESIDALAAGTYAVDAGDDVRAGVLKADILSHHAGLSDTLEIIGHEVWSTVYPARVEELKPRPKMEIVLTAHQKTKAVMKKAKDYDRAKSANTMKVKPFRNVPNNVSHRSYNWY